MSGRPVVTEQDVQAVTRAARRAARTHPEDAEDVAQHALMLGVAGAKDNPAAWAMRSVHRIARDIRRHREVRAVVPLADRDTASASVHDEYEARHLSMDVRSAFAELPRECAAAVLLHDCEDQPIEAVAARLGVDVYAAKRYLARGRRMLRDLLAAHVR